MPGNERSFTWPPLQSQELSIEITGQLEAVEAPRNRGRRRSVEAEAAILKATLYLLERKPLRKVTADAIARRACVSKATIYKWWPNKSLVALDAYLAGMSEQVVLPDTGSAEMDFSQQLKSVMAFYTSPLGRLFCQFLAEGQSDPVFLALFRERFLYARRNSARVMWQRGVDRGEIRKEVDGEIVLDLIYGPMIFRLLAGHGSLAERESEAVVAAVFGGLKRPNYRPAVNLSDGRATWNEGAGQVVSPTKHKERLISERNV
jgi:AcrR family transcriptional regulator